ncbi:hypothetical protein ACFL0J_06725 [Candidatus Neomarinimicrobiota bacterium]
MINRNIYPRNRKLKEKQSYWNPLFLQHKFLIDSAKKYFNTLPKDKKLTIYDFGCGQKPYRDFVLHHEYIGIDIDSKNQKADIFSDISNIPV